MLPVTNPVPPSSYSLLPAFIVLLSVTHLTLTEHLICNNQQTCGPCQDPSYCQLSCVGSESCKGSNQVIRCHDNMRCHIVCNGSDGPGSACVDAVMYMEESSINSTLDCMAHEDCKSAQLYASSNHLTINCNSHESCQALSVRASESAGDTIVNCIGDYACDQLYVECGSGHCLVDCSSAVSRTMICDGLHMICGAGDCVLDCTSLNNNENCPSVIIDTSLATSFTCIGSQTDCKHAPASFAHTHTVDPTPSPSTYPSDSPSSRSPSNVPSISPTDATLIPSASPSITITDKPSAVPTLDPTSIPTPQQVTLTRFPSSVEARTTIESTEVGQMESSSSSTTADLNISTTTSFSIVSSTSPSPTTNPSIPFGERKVSEQPVVTEDDSVERIHIVIHANGISPWYYAVIGAAVMLCLISVLSTCISFVLNLKRKRRRHERNSPCCKAYNTKEVTIFETQNQKINGDDSNDEDSQAIGDVMGPNSPMSEDDAENPLNEEGVEIEWRTIAQVVGETGYGNDSGVSRSVERDEQSELDRIGNRVMCHDEEVVDDINELIPTASAQELWTSDL